MKLQLFKTLWGHRGSIGEAAESARAAGFQGLEGPAPEDTGQQRELRESGLLYIAEISTTGYAVPAPRSTVEDHLMAFERRLALSLELQPLFCTCMGGNDLWDFADSLRFLSSALELARGAGADVSFETHRSRSLFHPRQTCALLRELPQLELTADFSHWCVVTERLVLDELPEVLALCASRVRHIHARVGYDQGAQVPDPRAPEYAPSVAANFAWWRALWESRRARGCEAVTMTPEFGPDGYLHEEPFTKKPVADLWELNVWMARALERAFMTGQAG